MNCNKASAWVKKYKDEMILAGTLLVTTVGTILFVNNIDKVKPLFLSISKTNKTKLSLCNVKTLSSLSEIEKSQIKIIRVRDHIRTLPQGYHPSELKVSEAVSLGIELKDNQTMVSRYLRRIVA